MKKILLVVSLCLVVLLGNCVTSSPMQSAIFTYTDQHTFGHVGQNKVTSAKILKSGESCSISSLILYPFFTGGGGSIKDAMKEAGITKVAVVDKSTLNFIFLFFKECTIVWGE